MSQVFAAFDAAWKVLLAGLVLGAGLPTLFAMGVNALAWGSGGDAEIHADGVTPRPHPLGRTLAYLIFALVLLCVALGLGYIIAHGFGWTLTFEGLLPVFKPKG